MKLFNKINSSSNVSKGYNKIRHGDPYTVCLDEEKKVIFYTSAITDMTNLIDKYLNTNNISKEKIDLQIYNLRKKDIFLKDEKLKQLCIVDSDVMIKEDVLELMKTVKLKADIRNPFMVGLDEFSRK